MPVSRNNTGTSTRFIGIKHGAISGFKVREELIEGAYWRVVRRPAIDVCLGFGSAELSEIAKRWESL